MELTKEQIEEINSKVPYGQGIFKEPYGIPNHIKELVIYTKWTSGGRPGSCWDDENTVNEYYTQDRPNDAFKILDLVLQILKPNTTFLQYKEIQNLVDSNTETDYGYYGDYTEDTIEWIVLSDLYKLLNQF